MSEERLLQRLEDLNGRLAELRERLPQSCMDERYDRRFYARLTWSRRRCTLACRSARCRIATT